MRGLFKKYLYSGDRARGFGSLKFVHKRIESVPSNILRRVSSLVFIYKFLSFASYQQLYFNLATHTVFENVS